MAALHRIVNGSGTMEHRTSTATCGLLQNYYPLNRNFIFTPEQSQETVFGGFKKPDYCVEKWENNTFVNVLFVEVKSLENSSFNAILDQLYDTILNIVDVEGGTFSVFVIAMKGTKIAIYNFSSYVSLLDEYNILNYKGFTPVNYMLTYHQWLDIYSNPSGYSDYVRNFNIPNSSILEQQGVESTDNIPYPHIFNLLETNNHAGYIHELFNKTYSTPGLLPD